MLKPIPKFIYSRANQIFMVLFVPFFALIFINLYRPLDFDRIDDSFLQAFDISREARVQLIALTMVLGGNGLLKAEAAAADAPESLARTRSTLKQRPRQSQRLRPARKSPILPRWQRLRESLSAQRPSR